MPEVITQKLVEKVLRESRRQEVADIRVRGLVLRGTQRGATWAVRSDKGGKTIKIGIGSPPEVGLADARTIAAAAVDRLNAGLAVDFRWIESQRIKVGIQHETATAAPAPRVRPRTWIYEDAVFAYLSSMNGKRRPATLDSYRWKLTHPALLEAFGGRAVVDIQRRHASRVVEAVGETRSTTELNASRDWHVSTATIVEGILRLISANPKRDTNAMITTDPGTRLVLRQGPKDRTPMRGIYLTGNDALLYAAVLNFAKACDEVFWKRADGTSFITKTVGVQALFDILRKIIIDALVAKNVSVEFYCEKLAPASGINFSSVEFKNASGSGRSLIRRTIEELIF